MPTSKRDDLFRQAGPEAVLQYLQSRLDGRDLSPDEALALLSALHEQLGRSEAGDPRMYASYGRFMSALEQEMPDVHRYVVTKWAESRHPKGRVAGAPDATWGTAGDLANGRDVGDHAGAGEQSHEVMRAVEPELGEEEVTGETGEPDEEDDSEQPQPARAGGGQRESGEDESDEVEAVSEISGETEDSSEDERLDETSDQAEAEEAAGSESESEEGRDDGGIENDEDNGQAEETAPNEDQETGEANGEGAADAAEGGGNAAGGEEGEWPAEESPEPGEALEDFEGEESEPPEAE